MPRTLELATRKAITTAAMKLYGLGQPEDAALFLLVDNKTDAKSFGMLID